MSMIFTDTFKIRQPLGFIHTETTAFNEFPYSVPAVDVTGNTIYNKPLPLQVGSISPSNFTIERAATSSKSLGFAFSTNIVESDHYPSGSTGIITEAAFTSILQQDNKVIVRFTLTNSGASAINIMSVAYITMGSFASSSGSTSGTNKYYIAMYENFSTPLTIPANDSIFVDIVIENSTFSAQQG